MSTFKSSIGAEVKSKTASCGAIAKLTLPEGFVLGEEVRGGMGNNWTVSYNPPDTEAVEIMLFYRGTPDRGVDPARFRGLLEKSPHELFDLSKQSDNMPPDTIETLVAIQDLLGNAGNNQITNTRDGLQGPRFQIEKVETMELNGRNVLGVRGFFHSYKGVSDLHNYYYGIFFDVAANKEWCQIEEIIYQGDTKELFERYWNDFFGSLSSISWKR